MDRLQEVLSTFETPEIPPVGWNAILDASKQIKEVTEQPLHCGYKLSVDVIEAIMEIKDEAVSHIQLSIDVENKRVILVKKVGYAFDVNLWLSSLSSDVSEPAYHIIIEYCKDYGKDYEPRGAKNSANITFVSSFPKNDDCEEFVSCGKDLISLLREDFSYPIRDELIY